MGCDIGWASGACRVCSVAAGNACYTSVPQGSREDGRNEPAIVLRCCNDSWARGDVATGQPPSHGCEAKTYMYTGTGCLKVAAASSSHQAISSSQCHCWAPSGWPLCGRQRMRATTSWCSASRTKHLDGAALHTTHWAAPPWQRCTAPLAAAHMTTAHPHDLAWR